MSIKFICNCGSEDIDVFSASEKVRIDGKSEIPIVEIIYICNSCGKTKSNIHYLYKDKIKKSRKEQRRKVKSEKNKESLNTLNTYVNRLNKLSETTLTINSILVSSTENLYYRIYKIDNRLYLLNSDKEGNLFVDIKDHEVKSKLKRTIKSICDMDKSEIYDTVKMLRLKPIELEGLSRIYY